MCQRGLEFGGNVGNDSRKEGSGWNERIFGGC
jgi:hypothetical protein